jgi:hypothetical protein
MVKGNKKSALKALKIDSRGMFLYVEDYDDCDHYNAGDYGDHTSHPSISIFNSLSISLYSGLSLFLHRMMSK